MRIKEKKQIRQLKIVFILIFILIGEIFLFTTVVFYNQKRSDEKSFYSIQQRELVLTLQKRLYDSMSGAVEDLQVLRGHVELSKFLGTEPGSEPGTPRASNFVNNDNLYEEYKKDLANEFQTLLNYKDDYDQVRLLSLRGMEILRIDRNDNGPYIVPENKLQNKIDRYYFQDALKLANDDVYVSPFDLNVEGGKVDIPYKPVIRFGISVFESGTRQGILFLNYLGSEIINIVKEADLSRKSSVSLLNRDGYFLSTDDAAKEWGFMFDEKKHLTLRQTNPNLWNKIRSGTSAQFFEGGGIYTFIKLYPFAEVQVSSLGTSEIYGSSTGSLDPKEYELSLISFISNDVMFAESRNLLNVIIIMNYMFFALLGIGGFFLYNAIKRRLLAERRVLNLNSILSLLNKILRHDLANSFTAVLWGIDNILETTKIKKKNVELLGDIKISAVRSIDLIREMKELEKTAAVAGKAKKYVLRKAIQKVMRNYPKIEYKILGAATIEADEALMVILNNLVENARRHGGSTYIKFTITKTKHFLELSVADNGKSIPKKVWNRLFVEGYKYGKSGNSGIGLYIVGSTMDRYGGEVGLGDTEGGGTTFILKFPLVSVISHK